jgi:phosphoribosylformylglycinamidine cyclo-ligase
MTSYAKAGVDIEAGSRATRLMAEAVRSTYGAEVLAGIGAFGGLYDAGALKAMDAPVLVASTDGVGTKMKVAAKLNRWDTVGQDLVNHCVNDILVQGARPLFFLDYVASSRLNPEQIAAIVSGAAAACRAVGCALLGGETAEMPGVYEAGEVDLAGTIVGVVERSRVIDGSRIQPGDAVLALPSSGLHTNGYSLARRVLADLDWTEPLPELNGSIGDALLAVHRCYLEPVSQLGAVDIRGMAHITGGGVIDNLPRIFPPGVGAVINRGTWDEPAIFGLIQEVGQVDDAEMFHVFNMGLGMLLVVPPDQVSAAKALLPTLAQIGEIVAADAGKPVVIA